MKTLNTVQSSTSESPAPRFMSARALAFSLAESNSEFIEPELIAWIDRAAVRASPVLEGCSGPNGWHDYGESHGGRLEVTVGDEASFIFAETGAYDSYEYFGPGAFINIRDAQGNEVLCRVGGTACVPLDDSTSKITCEL